MKTGFYPGSFDPVTNGHMDIIIRAMRLVDKLVIGIGNHPAKQAAFSADKRKQMLTACLDAAPVQAQAKQDNCQTEIVFFDGLTVEAARQYQADIIIRGLRNGDDFDYEARMVAMNHVLMPELETICLTASPQTAFISSTFVRQIAGMGGDVSAFVPAAIIDMVASGKKA